MSMLMAISMDCYIGASKHSEPAHHSEERSASARGFRRFAVTELVIRSWAIVRELN